MKLCALVLFLGITSLTFQAQSQSQFPGAVQEGNLLLALNATKDDLDSAKSAYTTAVNERQDLLKRSFNCVDSKGTDGKMATICNRTSRDYRDHDRLRELSEKVNAAWAKFRAAHEAHKTADLAFYKFMQEKDLAQANAEEPRDSVQPTENSRRRNGNKRSRGTSSVDE